jgi:hypothetical protein
VAKALGYKPEGHGFETRWGEILNLPLTEMSTGNIKKNVLGSKVWLMSGADNLTAICEPVYICLLYYNCTDCK